MGLPDNRDIEPIRDDSIDGYNNQPEFVMHQIEENEQQMDVDDDSDNDGYLRLQTFDNGDEIPANDSDSSGSDEEDENEYAFTTENFEENISAEPASSVPPIVTADSELQAEVWNSPRPQDTIELNSEKTEQILKAMSKFTLPNVPQWANEVNPRELIQRIRNKDHPKTPTDKN